ncbi:adenylate/guanylate cyclase domain-containing protein, partial [bacterium]|nr:adenylate/guanylate cyclase domain-containing protein [bacterium]
TRILTLFKDLLKNGNPFSVRIGLNSGRAIHGNVGARLRREYTYIGDAVNIAQRLESNCKPGCLLMSPSVYENCGYKFNHSVEREIPLKGKEKPMLAIECEI